MHFLKSIETLLDKVDDGSLLDRETRHKDDDDVPEDSPRSGVAPGWGTTQQQQQQPTSGARSAAALKAGVSDLFAGASSRAGEGMTSAVSFFKGAVAHLHSELMTTDSPQSASATPMTKKGAKTSPSPTAPSTHPGKDGGTQQPGAGMKQQVDFFESFGLADTGKEAPKRPRLPLPPQASRPDQPVRVDRPVSAVESGKPPLAASAAPEPSVRPVESAPPSLPAPTVAAAQRLSPSHSNVSSSSSHPSSAFSLLPSEGGAMSGSFLLVGKTGSNRSSPCEKRERATTSPVMRHSTEAIDAGSGADGGGGGGGEIVAAPVAVEGGGGVENGLGEGDRALPASDGPQRQPAAVVMPAGPSAASPRFGTSSPPLPSSQVFTESSREVSSEAGGPLGSQDTDRSRQPPHASPPHEPAAALPSPSVTTENSEEIEATNSNESDEAHRIASPCVSPTPVSLNALNAAAHSAPASAALDSTPPADAGEDMNSSSSCADGSHITRTVVKLQPPTEMMADVDMDVPLPLSSESAPEGHGQPPLPSPPLSPEVVSRDTDGLSPPAPETTTQERELSARSAMEDSPRALQAASEGWGVEDLSIDDLATPQAGDEGAEQLLPSHDEAPLIDVGESGGLSPRAVESANVQLPIDAVESTEPQLQQQQHQAASLTPLAEGVPDEPLPALEEPREQQHQQKQHQQHQQQQEQQEQQEHSPDALIRPDEPAQPSASTTAETSLPPPTATSAFVGTDAAVLTSPSARVAMETQTSEDHPRAPADAPSSPGKEGADVRQLWRLLEGLRRENCSYQQQIERLQAEKHDKEALNETLAKQLADLEAKSASDMQAMQAAQDSLTAEHASRVQEIQSQLDGEVAAGSAKLAAAQAKAMSLQEGLDAHQRRIEELTHQSEEALRQRDQMGDNQSAMEAKLQEAYRELNTTSEDNAELRRLWQQEKNGNQQLTGEMDAVRQQLASAVQRAEAAEESCRAQRKQAEKEMLEFKKETQAVHEAETEQVKTEIEQELHSLLMGKDGQIDQYRKELNQANNQVKSLQADLLMSRREVDSLQGLIQEKQQAYEQSESEHSAEMERYRERHRVELEHLRQHLSSFDQLQSDVVETEASLRADLSKQEQEKQAALDRCAELQAQFDDLQQAYGEIGGELTAVQRRFDDMASSRKQSVSEQDSSHRQLLSLQDRLKTTEQELSEARYISDLFKKENDMYRQEVAHLKDDNAKLQERVRRLSEQTTADTAQRQPHAAQVPSQVMEEAERRYREEINYLKRRIDEKDKRIETLVCERTTQRYELQQLRQDMAADSDMERGENIRARGTAGAGAAPEGEEAETVMKFVHKVDQPLRSFTRLLFVSPPIRLVFYVYVAFLHLYCLFLLHLFSPKSQLDT
ncbi:unnamed protein product [Vitrella brassicaformis CCMP3155]|uniref:Golgin-84 n=2 Tax=Vitrella brassicaformis TaxID=1169539 RepID=A0A0G4EXX6_VITBC|nr:unnamed protein product [Vitrella brassicaformis CCMP3155]|eukprot:CEM03469.1 unnamed protein product [Vitrella brassicaformis CCMP3155]